MCLRCLKHDNLNFEGISTHLTDDDYQIRSLESWKSEVILKFECKKNLTVVDINVNRLIKS